MFIQFKIQGFSLCPVRKTENTSGIFSGGALVQGAGCPVPGRLKEPTGLRTSADSSWELFQLEIHVRCFRERAH